MDKYKICDEVFVDICYLITVEQKFNKGYDNIGERNVVFLTNIKCMIDVFGVNVKKYSL